LLNNNEVYYIDRVKSINTALNVIMLHIKYYINKEYKVNQPSTFLTCMF